MFSYNIEIQGNDNGEIFYSVTFQHGKRHEPEIFNSAKINSIHNTVEHLAEALTQLSTTA